LTHVTVVTDPDYLSEPLIKSQDFTLTTDESGIGTGGIINGWLYPCEYVEEIPGRALDHVPSYLPGENPFVSEFADKHKVPMAAAMGGAETMYPEYRKKLP